MKNALQHWPSIRRSIESSGETLFLFDFDGTLSRIVDHPDRATIGAGIQPLVRLISLEGKSTVGIISGRRLSDVRKKIGLRNVVYAGNHGLEIAGKGLHFIHEAARANKRTLAKILRAAPAASKNARGLVVENKGLTGTIHFRNVRSSNRRRVMRMLTGMKDLCELDGFNVRPGKEICEIIPAVGWDKGTAVRWLEQQFKRPLVVYIGDDTTDEDAFRAIRGRGIGIRVGASAASAAGYFLRSQADVRRFLQKVVTS